MELYFITTYYYEHKVLGYYSSNRLCCHSVIAMFEHVNRCKARDLANIILCNVMSSIHSSSDHCSPFRNAVHNVNKLHDLYAVQAVINVTVPRVSQHRWLYTLMYFLVFHTPLRVLLTFASLKFCCYDNTRHSNSIELGGEDTNITIHNGCERCLIYYYYHYDYYYFYFYYY